MIERKLIPAEPDSPTRCQSPGDAGEGQCKFESMPGTQKCAKHGAVQELRGIEKKKVHDYRLQIWQENLDHFAESDNVKNLRGEIAILRMVQENILNMCKEPADLMLYSGRLSNLCAGIDKLLLSCDKLESKMGTLLDKSAALLLASQVVNVITKHVTDPAVVDEISKGIIDILSSIGTETNGSV